MRVYYSVQSLYNPVFRPVTSRFRDHCQGRRESGPLGRREWCATDMMIGRQ